MGIWQARPDGHWWSGSTKGPAWGDPPPWPTPETIGWQAAGATLTNYTGPTTLQLGQTITAKTVTSDLIIQSAATILRSAIAGRIDTDGPSYSLLIEDSNIDAGTVDAAAIGFHNLTIRRCHIVGGANSVIGGNNVLIEDSILHDQHLGAEAGSHENAFLSNGGTGVIIRRCVLHANQPDNGHDGGVSTNLSLFGDYAPIADVLIEDCLIKATPGAFGVSLGYNPGWPDEGKEYGDNPTGIIFRNNVFERGTSGKCGVIGPVTGWLDQPGNEFYGNVYEDGTTVEAA